MIFIKDKFFKFLKFLLFLLPWFISGIIFRSDSAYYNNLDKPWFAPAPIIFGIVWPILYILIAYFLYKTWDNKDSYRSDLIVNYIANQLFTFTFFFLKNNFLALIDVIVILISSINLYRKGKILKGNIANYLVPYIIWNIYALILIFSIFILN